MKSNIRIRKTDIKDKLLLVTMQLNYNTTKLSEAGKNILKKFLLF